MSCFAADTQWLRHAFAECRVTGRASPAGLGSYKYNILTSRTSSQDELAALMFNEMKVNSRDSNANWRMTLY